MSASSPKRMLVGASCTAELIQDDPGGLAKALELADPGRPARTAAYQRKENWGASETFYQLVRALAGPHGPRAGTQARSAEPAPRPRAICSGRRRSASAIATMSAKSRGLLEQLGIDSQCRRAAWARRPRDLARLGEADFNVVLYPEIAGQAAQWLKRTFGQPLRKTDPDRRRRNARFHRRSRGSRRHRSRSRCCREQRRACPGTRARSIRPI